MYEVIDMRSNFGCTEVLLTTYLLSLHLLLLLWYLYQGSRVFVSPVAPKISEADLCILTLIQTTPNR
jgi:hypothetical protein